MAVRAYTEDIEDINTVMEDPIERGAYAYHEAKSALSALLDSSDRAWEDLFVLVRSVARSRRADLVCDALDLYRPGITQAARYQDMADKLTEPMRPEQSLLDADL